jgi:hypothetical protein
VPPSGSLKPGSNPARSAAATVSGPTTPSDRIRCER